MTGQTQTESLAGKFLIAMPAMGDPRFAHSLIMMCAHSAEGAMGLIVNRRVPKLALDDLLEQLDIPKGPGSGGVPVHFGGPVEGGRGFVLHSTDYPGHEGTIRINADFAMTATRDVLVDIAAGRGPRRVIAALGYSGWGPGQLESELRQNAWLTADADPDIVFDSDDLAKWERALRALGIDPLMLSGEGGRA
ncbi:MAG: YqgE/AlgH family protein [Alphaproteobacteria bacterium]|nr:MAG: YqgE/AlgH family protein [Alphaproteobacteria bacterium]